MYSWIRGSRFRTVILFFYKPDSPPENVRKNDDKTDLTSRQFLRGKSKYFFNSIDFVILIQ